jgi:deazaflavin-dependent oxidoreductase (nitroreductase family)
MPAAPERDGFDRRVVDEFRANRGRVGGSLAHTPILLLHHIGARSGIARVTPLAYLRLAEGRYAIAASNAGSRRHPRWYRNLAARPRVRIELGGETFAVEAEELHGPRRDAVWSQLTAASPALREYQARTSRRIPVLTLTRPPGAAISAAGTALKAAS